MTGYEEAVKRRGEASRTWETQLIHHLGFNYVILEAPARPFGAVESKNVAVISNLYGRQYGLFRCTREGEFIGWGWLEHIDGSGRSEYRTWGEFYAAIKSLANAHGIRERRGGS